MLAGYRGAGGKVDRAFAQDPSLRDAVEKCRNAEGNFELSGEVCTAFDRVMRKTAQGLFYGLYDRVPPLEKFELISLEHSEYQTSKEVVSRLRKPGFRDLTDEALPELTARGSPNVYVMQAMLTNMETEQSQPIDHRVFYDARQLDVEWIVYQEGTLRFTFFQGVSGDAICVMNLWNTLICAVRAPWPSQRGTLRKGRRNPNAR